MRLFGREEFRTLLEVAGGGPEYPVNYVPRARGGAPARPDVFSERLKVAH
jgi:hypothetical protein